jgi:hypothetical protein
MAGSRIMFQGRRQSTNVFSWILKAFEGMASGPRQSQETLDFIRFENVN